MRKMIFNITFGFKYSKIKYVLLCPIPMHSDGFKKLKFDFKVLVVNLRGLQSNNFWSKELRKKIADLNKIAVVNKMHQLKYNVQHVLKNVWVAMLW